MTPLQTKLESTDRAHLHGNLWMQQTIKLVNVLHECHGTSCLIEQVSSVSSALHPDSAFFIWNCIYKKVWVYTWTRGDTSLSFVLLAQKTDKVCAFTWWVFSDRPFPLTALFDRCAGLLLRSQCSILALKCSHQHLPCPLCVHKLDRTKILLTHFLPLGH